MEKWKQIQSINPFTRTAAAALLLSTVTVAANPIVDVQAQDGGAGISASATGGGHILISGSLDVRFSMSAVQSGDGFASGQFRHTVEFQGFGVDFAGYVTCLAVDADAGRAWIGGVISENRSDHPSFTGAVHQPGKDIWFRVLDNGEGSAEPDRSTFVGFEGSAGIITSQEYCDLMPWPEDNARTSPVTQGNIQVRP